MKGENPSGFPLSSFSNPDMNHQETIRLARLSIGYPGKASTKVVARDITETIRSGELTCLLGENGSGKSTLLRTLSGFLPPISGEITILGRPIRDYSDNELARVVGVVLTDKSSLANMTVDELVGMGRSPYTGFWGLLSAEDRQKVDEALDLVGITPLRTRMVQTLSDGERQKAMIAKALAQETPIIFLDEPTAFLDYPSKVETLHLLHRLSHDTGKTIFMSTHDLELALQVADRLWLMARKREVMAGTPEDLALNGVLGTFFQRDGVVFEQRTGLYRIEPSYNLEMRMIGDAVFCSLAAKALRRNGVHAEFDSPAELTLVADPSARDRFIVRRGETILLRAGSIDELLHNLEKIDNQ